VPGSVQTDPFAGRGVLSSLFLVLSVVLAAWSCRPPSPEPQRYELSGQILAVRSDEGEVLIKHGDIKSFMPGMTMPFKVRDRALLTGKAPGDLVTAQLMVGTNEAWLATLDKTGTAPLEEAAATLPAASFVTPFTPGDEVAAPPLTDDAGGTLSLADWRGSAVVVTFIYTRCPLPQFCPLMDRRFAEIQRLIKHDDALRTRTRLLSISFDPAADTPAVLKQHAAKLGADPSIWRFATAPAEVVDRMAATFGVNVIRENDGTITHNLRTVVIDPRGRVAETYARDDWTPADVVAVVRTALDTR
jgi:protein SCO1